MKKQWLEGKFENTTYYYLASDPYVHEIFEKEKLDKDSIMEIVKKKGFINKDWGKHMDVIFPREEKNVPVEHAIELPPGIYRLKPHDGRPMRLEMMNVREEGYMPLTEHEGLVTDIARFLGAKSLYEQLQFIYRRGYLFYGEPGTGKTAFIRHLARQDYFKGAHLIWIDFVPPANFVTALNETNTMKVIIMEELLQENGRLGYEMSKLLEFMDGENAIKDCVTIATTNYPQYLHKNLADRPSRFDVLFEMKKQPLTIVKKVIEQWLDREVLDNELTFNDYSLAQLKEIVLLHKFYSISLNEAAKKLKAQSEKFQNGFEEKKELGFGIRVSEDDDE